jgi:hypothetical protein
MMAAMNFDNLVAVLAVAAALPLILTAAAVAAIVCSRPEHGPGAGARSSAALSGAINEEPPAA